MSVPWSTATICFCYILVRVEPNTRTSQEEGFGFHELSLQTKNLNYSEHEKRPKIEQLRIMINILRICCAIQTLFCDAAVAIFHRYVAAPVNVHI